MKDLPITAKAVRVSSPVWVAGNIGSLKESFASILDRPGRPACATVCYILLKMAELFVIDQNLAVEAPVLRVG